MDIQFANKRQKLIYELIVAGKGEWTEMVAVIKNAKNPPTNWMLVRGELQGLINAGLVKREPSVHVERYVKTEE